ncbi:MAG: GNAT family N-acetyltransferase [Candidatus Pacebacteria bacterium]|nr:GNAT family N-acetyltransferase [Candidatus Paceibacterota bacterium]
MLKKFKTKKGKEVSIRYLLKSDTRDLLDVYNSLVDEKSYTVATRKFTLKEEKLFIANSLVKIENGEAVHLVAECNGKTLGIATIEKEISPILEHRGDFGIMLKKEIRGEGVGEELMKTVISEAKKFLKVKMIILRAFEENKPAISLYTKLNFKKVGGIEKGLKHFGKYKNEIIMAKYI